LTNMPHYSYLRKVICAMGASSLKVT